METRNRHPSDLELELARTGEAPGEVPSHLAGCPECRENSRMLENLAAALRGHSPRVRIPERVEARILREARRVAKGRRHGRFRWAAAAAAAVLLVVVTWVLHSPIESPAPPDRIASTSHAGDVNGDGIVDILDAYRLARWIEARGRLEAAWDLDGDGRVDRGDVDTIARSAVRVDREFRR